MAENTQNTNETAQGKLILEGSVSSYNDDVRALFFNTVTDDSLSFNSQITDNWLENNTSIQDHITLSPVTITMKGLIGEVVYTPQAAFADYNNIYTNNFGGELLNNYLLGKLNTVSSFFPSVSNITQKAINKINLKDDAISKVLSIANTSLNQPGYNSLAQKLDNYAGITSNIRQERQKQIIELLKHYWLNRMPFKAIVPWGEYDNMFIESVNINQGNINYASEISITLKQVRYAQTIYTKADEKVLAQYAQVQQAPEENYGKSGGEETGLAKMADSFGRTPGTGYKR